MAYAREFKAKKRKKNICAMYTKPQKVAALNRNEIDFLFSLRAPSYFTASNFITKFSPFRVCAKTKQKKFNAAINYALCGG